MTFLRTLLYLWASPNTLLGAVLLALGLVGGGRVRVVSGVVEAHGRFLGWCLGRFTHPVCGGASAITFGHVVIARDQTSLDETREHERVHVEQYERWGPFFLPAYLLSSLIALLRGLDPYLENHFEREAFRRADV